MCACHESPVETCAAEKNAATPPLDNPPSVSAEELHIILLKAFKIGNLARRKFLQALLAMDSSRLYLQLGFSSIAQYAEKHFGCQHTQTYDLLRVAAALRELPLCDLAFKEGRLSWSALREITKVATLESEGDWLNFASSHTFAQLHAEVKDAQKKGRTKPREDGLGLPYLTVKLKFELPPEEHELVSKAISKAARELERSLGPGAFVEPKDALLYMSKRLLETDLAGDSAAEGGPAAASGVRVEREDSIFTILYVMCPQCRKTSLPTADGPIELPPEVVERVEPEAKKVTITLEEELAGASRPEPSPKPVPKAERDQPNTALLVKKVRLREAGVCANPGCRRRGICHVHHLEFRLNGGKTVLSNTLLLCKFCHAAVHLGLLKIEGNPFTGLTFRRKTIPTLADFQLEVKELSSFPEIRLEVRSGIDGLGRNGTSRRHSAIADSAVAESAIAGAPGSADEGLQKALMKIGYSKAEARKRLQLAREKLCTAGGGKEPAEEEILLAAIRG